MNHTQDTLGSLNIGIWILFGRAASSAELIC